MNHTILTNQAFKLYDRLNTMSYDFGISFTNRVRCKRLSSVAYKRYQRRLGDKYDHDKIKKDFLQILIDTE